MTHTHTHIHVHTYLCAYSKRRRSKLLESVITHKQHMTMIFFVEKEEKAKKTWRYGTMLQM